MFYMRGHNCLCPLWECSWRVLSVSVHGASSLCPACPPSLLGCSPLSHPVSKSNLQLFASNLLLLSIYAQLLLSCDCNTYFHFVSHFAWASIISFTPVLSSFLLDMCFLHPNRLCIDHRSPLSSEHSVLFWFSSTLEEMFIVSSLQSPFALKHLFCTFIYFLHLSFIFTDLSSFLLLFFLFIMLRFSPALSLETFCPFKW